MIQFRTILADSQQTISEYINRLRQIGYDQLSRIPTYQALAHYKKALYWEDLYYKYLDTDSMLIFKEAGNESRFIHSHIVDKKDFFTGLLTNGLVEKTDFKKYVGEDILDKLKKAGLAKTTGDKIIFYFRIIPTFLGPILSDTFSQTNKMGIHIGLDSILFWNFLSHQHHISGAHHAIDVGCGTGVHSLLLKSKNPDMEIVCSDVNKRCLDCAEVNMHLNKINHNIKYLQSVWFDEIDISNKKYDLIICNPPFEWRTKDEASFQTMANYGGNKLGLESTLHVIEKMPLFLSLDGKGYILSQSIMTSGGDLLLIKEIKDKLSGWQRNCRIHVTILFEHLFTSERQIQEMISQGLSHFAMVIIEVDKRIVNNNHIFVSDDRPLPKKISDMLRVKACKKFWKYYLRNR